MHLQISGRSRDMRETADHLLRDAPSSCACISVAENAADNRGTQVRFLAGAPTRREHEHDRPVQTGPSDPERKPEWRGTGLLTQPQPDRNRGVLQARTSSLMGRAAVS